MDGNLRYKDDVHGHRGRKYLSGDMKPLVWNSEDLSFQMSPTGCVSLETPLQALKFYYGHSERVVVFQAGKDKNTWFDNGVEYLKSGRPCLEIHIWRIVITTRNNLSVSLNVSLSSQMFGLELKNHQNFFQFTSIFACVGFTHVVQSESTSMELVINSELLSRC